MAFTRRRMPFIGGSGIPTLKQDMFLNDPGMGGGRIIPRLNITQKNVMPSHARAREAIRPRRIPSDGKINRYDVRDLSMGYTPQTHWPRFRGESFHPRLTPGQFNRAMSERQRDSLASVRPFKGPRGIGLYKGTKTGKGRPNPHGPARNPVTLMNMLWQRFKPWDIF